MEHIRTAWISDVHLGTRGSAAEALLEFFRRYDAETLYIVGDFIDVWSLRRGIYWPQTHNDVIQKVLRKGRKGSRIIYIPGNHDEFVTNFIGQYGSISIQPRAIHETADRRRLLIIHGHELDAVVQNIRWLAHVGDIGYQLLLLLNHPVNFIRKMLGLRMWSLSAYVKMRVKDAVSFIGKFEEAIVHFAAQENVEGVLCGHIHSASIRKIGDLQYYNCGDWVESRSALIERFDGTIELVRNIQPSEQPHPPEEEADLPLPLPAALAGPFRSNGNGSAKSDHAPRA